MGEVTRCVRVQMAFTVTVTVRNCGAVQHCVDTGISIARRSATFVCSTYASLIFEESPLKLLAVGSLKSVKLNETTCLSTTQTIHSSNMVDFSDSRKLVNELLTKAKEVANGKSLAEGGIEVKWVLSYGVIARRCREDKDFGVTPYPNDQGDGVVAFASEFFEHREWPPCKNMEKHQSLRAVAEYEANYINSAGHWMAFHEAALDLRQEMLEEKNEEEANNYDVWAALALRYGLRVVVLRSKFYKMAARDPTYAKMILLTLQQRNEVAASDDLSEAMDKFDSHMTTQPMKAVATLCASNETKRTEKGGPAGDN